MNLVIIGDTAKDINIFKGRKTNEESNKDVIMINNGGACYYSAVGASVFDKCGVVTKIGQDFDIDNYRNLGVDITGIKMIKGNTTRFFQTFLSADGQERAFRAERNSSSKVYFEDIPRSYLANAEYILISTTLPENQLQLIQTIRKSSNAKIAVDTLKEFANEEVTREVFDSADIAFIDREFEKLLNTKAKIKIIKYGKTGCLYIDGKKTIAQRNSVIIPDKEVVDKTGAGDILTGAFLTLLSKTKNPQIALKKANELATESITEYGVEHLDKKYVKRNEGIEL